MKNNFEECWELYCDAFPIDERRPIDYQKAAMECENYHFEALFDGDTHIGIIGWWDLENVRYIEHLATFTHLRGQKYGERILKQFLGESSEMVLLEVEPPLCEMSSRRVGFYQRLGFVLNDYEYFQPSYHGTDPVKLLAMTYPEAINREELEQFKTRNFPIIHFRANSW